MQGGSSRLAVFPVARVYCPGPGRTGKLAAKDSLGEVRKTRPTVPHSRSRIAFFSTGATATCRHGAMVTKVHLRNKARYSVTATSLMSRGAAAWGVERSRSGSLLGGVVQRAVKAQAMMRSGGQQVLAGGRVVAVRRPDAGARVVQVLIDRGVVEIAPAGREGDLLRAKCQQQFPKTPPPRPGRRFQRTMPVVAWVPKSPVACALANTRNLPATPHSSG